jgi:hypothetical protein
VRLNNTLRDSQTSSLDWSRRTADSVAPSLWEVAAVAALIPFYWFADLLGEASDEFTSLIGPICLIIVLVVGVVRSTLLESATIWTALFWFRISTAVYFGLGSILHKFMNETTLLSVWRFYYADEVVIAKFNLIVAFSVLCVLGTAWLLATFMPAPRQSVSNDSDEKLLLLVGLTCATLGYPVKYLISIPYFMGVYGDWVMPGLLGSVALLTPITLFIMTLWSLRYNRAWLPLIVVVLVVDMVSGAMTFSKGEILLPLMMFILAQLQHRISLKRASIAVGVVILTYMLATPFVTSGREQLMIRYGVLTSSSLTERMEISLSYIEAENPYQEYQGALARLAYVHSAAPAIALYDSGRPGNSLDHAFAIFIPRVLWPEKPIFDMGTEYNVLVAGTNTSSTWMGFFAEAYWDFGWFGIPLVMIPLGAIYFFFSRVTLSILNQGRWLHFPVVFLGMWLGMRVDGVIATEIIGSTLFALVLYGLATVGERFVNIWLFRRQENRGWSMLMRRNPGAFAMHSRTGDRQAGEHP